MVGGMSARMLFLGVEAAPTRGFVPVGHRGLL
jgi:hypothetical protein